VHAFFHYRVLLALRKNEGRCIAFAATNLSNLPEPTRILVAPLDWGLGHATRCMPIIQELERQGVLPVLASAGSAAEYLQKERPELPFFKLPAYGVRYRTHNMAYNMALQLPRILHTIWQEQRYVQRIIRSQKISAIISDNRYGAWSKAVPSVLVSHQLHLRVPYRLGSPVNAIHRKALRRFTACWVPDEPGADSLSGSLSIPRGSLQLRHIGLLSRFAGSPTEKREEAAIEALALLSGPEPQRSILEQEILPQLREISGLCVVVGGKRGAATHWESGNIQYYSLLKADKLAPLLRRAKTVICRSGYSSLMDLAALGKQALLIPTPGQTEQLYLARRLQQQQRVVVQRQGSLRLAEGIAAAQQLKGLPSPLQSNHRLSAAVGHLLKLAAPRG